MSTKLISLTFLFSIFVMVACSSGPKNGYRRGTEADSSGSTAPGWAYAAEGFMINKDQPIRNENAYEFYYKRCELSSERAYYSKTSYECSQAPR